MASWLTPRDFELFRELARGPLTVRQIIKVSSTFSVAFPSDRRTQRRLHDLARAGLLRHHWYHTRGPGSQSYYTLSPKSYRLLHGEDCPLPTTFGDVGISREHHTRCLADFIVHTLVGARRSNITVADFYRENALELAVGEERLFPDAAFTLVLPSGQAFRYFAELDNSTEMLVASDKNRDSWQRKLRFYEDLQDTCGYRFRVLGIVTRSQSRLEHLLAAAAEAARNPQRSLFYGIHLSGYLAQEEPVSSACFLNHRQEAVSLVPATNWHVVISPPVLSASLAGVGIVR